MRKFISPEIRSYTSEEILEMIGPAETQYATFNEDLPEVTLPASQCVDLFAFSAEAGTNITATAVPSAGLDIRLMATDGVVLFAVNANGAGGPETGSATIPSTGTWLIFVWNLFSGGSGSYTLTVSSDRPLSNWTVVYDDFCR